MCQGTPPVPVEVAGSAEALPGFAPQFADYLLAPYREEGTTVRRISSAAARGPM
jgi:hypothetical protein